MACLFARFCNKTAKQKADMFGILRANQLSSQKIFFFFFSPFGAFMCSLALSLQLWHETHKNKLNLLHSMKMLRDLTTTTHEKYQQKNGKMVRHIIASICEREMKESQIQCIVSFVPAVAVEQPIQTYVMSHARLWLFLPFISVWFCFDSACCCPIE